MLCGQRLPLPGQGEGFLQQWCAFRENGRIGLRRLLQPMLTLLGQARVFAGGSEKCRGIARLEAEVKTKIFIGQQFGPRWVGHVHRLKVLSAA